MSQLARQELAEILFQEIGIYIPKIQDCLKSLYADSENYETLYELHRLFHNIKGAASQVAFLSLSRTAAIGEECMAALMESPPTPDSLDFLTSLTNDIQQFCILEHKSPEEEEKLFADASVHFLRFVETENSLKNIEMDETLSNLIADAAARSETAVSAETSDSKTQQHTLQAFRSVIPLLTEFTRYTSENRIGQEGLISLSDAVDTMAKCSSAAGLSSLSNLLSDFQTVTSLLIERPSLWDAEIQNFFQDFFNYLDLLFSLDPEETENKIVRIQGTMKGVIHSLTDQDHFGSNSLPEELEIDSDPELFEQDNLFDTEQLYTLLDDEDNKDHPSLFDDGEIEALLTEEEAHTDSETTMFSQSDLDELFTIFQEECEEHLQIIGHELHKLENHVRSESPLTSDLHESVSNMRRAVHTLKGAAAMTGFDLIAGCAHSLEDVLDWLADSAEIITGEDISVIAQAVDVIENMASDPLAVDGAADQVTELLKNHMVHQGDETINQFVHEYEEETAGKQESASTKEVNAQEPITLMESDELVSDEEESYESTGNVRVKLEDLDELAAIEGELILARGSLEKQLENFAQSISDMGTVKEMLQRKSQELEIGFEAQSLYGFGPGGIPFGPEISETLPATDPEFDPFELDQYSQLNLIIRSLNEISSDINALHNQLDTLCTGMRGQVAKQQLSMGLMQEMMLRIRMTPFSSISRFLYRTVRQTAADLKKDVMLSISGEEVYMDRYIWSKVLDPLMHIIRNCVDHGIEDAKTRVSAGKPETGQIRIDAHQRSRNVVLRISDDGSGVNIESLRKKLLAEGRIEPDKTYEDEELLPFLFQPSFSTKEEVSTTSGRGVGLDVVVKNIKELRGSVQLSSRPGQGVVFELTIPVTLSVNRAMIVEVAGREYAVPLQDVIEVNKFSVDQMSTDPVTTVHWRDQELKVIDLAPLLTHQIEPIDSESASRLMLIVATGSKYTAFQAERVVEQREIVIKDLGSHLKHVRGISGVTLTGEGGVIPILNLVELASAETTGVTAAITTDSTSTDKEEPANVLVIDDSISVRYAVTRLLESKSMKITQAVDGLDGLEQLETFTPDLIIVDIEMPRMNGYEFVTALQREEKFRQVPIVMLTSRASEKHRKKAFELGVTHYVTKPYQDDAFIELLQSTLKKQ